jgi:hypothetical protein
VKERTKEEGRKKSREKRNEVGGKEAGDKGRWEEGNSTTASPPQDLSWDK